MDTSQMVGVGIYTIPEARRLTRVPAQRIRRWIMGYAWAAEDQCRESAPVFQRQLPVLDGRLALGFLDLIEVRIIDALRRHGMSWNTIRRAERQATLRFGIDHPFASRWFKTDGRDIFIEISQEMDDSALMDICESQYAFRKMIEPCLIDLDFADDASAARWWPAGRNRRVVIDPARSFGQPIVARHGIPTSTLANAVRVEGNEEMVARWYEVDLRSLRDAVEYEKKLAA